MEFYQIYTLSLHDALPIFQRGEIILLHDLDHAPSRGAPVTLRVAAADESARPFARAAQEQAELDVIYHREAQRLVTAALPVGRGADQIERADAHICLGPVEIHAGEPVCKAHQKGQM